MLFGKRDEVDGAFAGACAVQRQEFHGSDGFVHEADDVGEGAVVLGETDDVVVSDSVEDVLYARAPPAIDGLSRVSDEEGGWRAEVVQELYLEVVDVLVFVDENVGIAGLDLGMRSDEGKAVDELVDEVTVSLRGFFLFDVLAKAVDDLRAGLVACVRAEVLDVLSVAFVIVEDEEEVVDEDGEELFVAFAAALSGREVDGGGA